MTDGQRLKQFVENQPRSVKSIYTEVGVSKAAWYEYYKAASMEPATKQKIEKVLGRSIFNVDVNIDHSNKNAPVGQLEPQQGHDTAMGTIRSLSEGNRNIAEANASLAKSNEALTLMVKQSVSVQSETLEVFGATLATLREFVLDLCMKSKVHHSKEEARAAFRIRLNEFLKNKKGVNIRDGSGK